MEIIKRIFIVLMTTLLSSINIIAANDTKTNTKAIADTFRQILEPNKEYKPPYEMVERQLGHDFGFGDYVD